MDKLYHVDFYVDCGHGELQGVTIMCDSMLADLNEIIKSDKSVYFGEVLGKHSEVYFPVESKMFIIKEIDKSFVKTANELQIDLEHGVQVLDYELVDL